MHDAIIQYLGFWRHNFIACTFLHAVVIGTIITAAREKYLIRKEGKPDARYV